jgi:hypothetical protein
MESNSRNPVEKKTASETRLKKDTFGWKKNIVKDRRAPAFYSQQAIWGFSAFFTAVFGAILLGINIKDQKNRWIVIGFGIVYTMVALFILKVIRPHAGIFLAINMGGGFILTQFFWYEYIGFETKFRSRSIWTPLIISLLILGMFTALIVYRGNT